ncbi:MAG TPA: fumarylacetoacetate hydrolase family protein [Candidatus Lustribacter sp.]|nr:fumarylacetoacetate hydrolase family protein [Candidatus Lustribacter sp.]
MKIARFDGGRIGVVIADRIHDVSDACGVDPAEWPPMGMITTIAAFDELRPGIERALALSVGQPLSGVRLETPIPWPHKLLALPNNFRAHTMEMGHAAEHAGTEGFFMKSSAALSGPAEAIVLPERPGRNFHYECELAIIVGKTGRKIALEDARDYIFGYACLIDVTMRGKEERVMRKSFDTFCPVGPWITTADEVGATDDIVLRLWVNGKLKQEAPVSDMVVGISEAVVLCSSVTTLQPGDIIAGGTMSGVGPIVPGDTVRIAIEKVGEMTIPVVADAPVTV